MAELDFQLTICLTPNRGFLIWISRSSKICGKNLGIAWTWMGKNCVFVLIHLWIKLNIFFNMSAITGLSIGSVDCITHKKTQVFLSAFQCNLFPLYFSVFYTNYLYYLYIYIKYFCLFYICVYFIHLKHCYESSSLDLPEGSMANTTEALFWTFASYPLQFCLFVLKPYLDIEL